ncbi:hypothetical protein L1987_12404 [Smallanthus sonchifolius]|uniref:Uncharacterized protein n=1 Tax=Smallanthus sonchifolius TaxID=185202 RepID=A0ACB9JH44_9ASTR|nr:hypothetical protein L1987_12404 [Smallanthus sonchifolius]
MSCKKHSTDLSSIAGVCASCLRERLVRVILAEKQLQAQSVEQNHCNSNTNPTVPRPVSPYISRRKSINSANPAATVHLQRPFNKPRLSHSQSDKRFYNSPQIAINTGGCIGGSSSNSKKPTLIRFPSISNLFRSNSRNGDADSNHRVSVSTSSKPYGTGDRPSSPFWNVLPGAGARQKNKAFYADERKQLCVRDRGMSPARSSNDGGEDELSDGSSGYESAESSKQTLKKTPSSRTVRRGGGQKSVTELIFCPLVGASPNRLLSMKGKPPVDGGYSGDIRAPAVPHISYAKSFSANRSRKIADFGRADPNR